MERCINAKTETRPNFLVSKSMYAPIVSCILTRFGLNNALDVSAFRQVRINHSELFADQWNHINGIENFWNQAKHHMRRFSGIKRTNCYWFLKEWEWRFNVGDYLQLLTQITSGYTHTNH